MSDSGFDKEGASNVCSFAIPMEGIEPFKRTAERLNAQAERFTCTGAMCPRSEYCAEVAKIAVAAVSIRLEIENNSQNPN